MTNETIIKKWRTGQTKFSIAKDYMQEHNREAKKRAKNNERPSSCLCRTNNI